MKLNKSEEKKINEWFFGTKKYDGPNEADFEKAKNAPQKIENLFDFSKEMFSNVGNYNFVVKYLKDLENDNIIINDDLKLDFEKVKPLYLEMLQKIKDVQENFQNQFSSIKVEYFKNIKIALSELLQDQSKNTNSNEDINESKEFKSNSILSEQKRMQELAGIKKDLL